MFLFVSFVCVEFKARPMPEDLRYFVHDNEDQFLENAKITEPIIAEMKMLRVGGVC